MKNILPAIFFLLIAITACQQEEVGLPAEPIDNVYLTVDKSIQKARDLYKDTPEESKEIALQALALSEKEYYLKGIKNSHNVLYWLYLQEYDNQEKATYHLKAYEAASNKVEQLQDLGALNYSKGLHLYNKGDYSSALPYLFESYDIYSLDNRLRQAGYSLYTAILILRKASLPHRGIKYIKKIDFESLDNTYQISTKKLEGLLYTDIGDIEKALASFKSAASLATDNVSAKAHILSSISLAHINLGQFTEAKTSIDEGLGLTQELNDDRLRADFYQKLGLLNEEKGNYQQAATYYAKAGGLYLSVNMPSDLFNIQNDLLHIYLVAGEYKKALSEGLSGLELVDNGDYGIKKKFYENLSTLSQRLGNEADYYKYQHKAALLQVDQLQNSQKVGVHKAELTYRNETEIRALETDIISHEQYMTKSRNMRWAIITSIVLTLAVLLIILLNRIPMRAYEGRVEKAHNLGLTIMEQLNGMIKAMSATRSGKISPPEAPDETDLYGTAGDKDKG
ncbi:MAG: hypothetical protein WBB45_21080 [Cyclobacteriaceae bacterium]